MTLGMRSSGHSANEHEKSRLVADDRDVSLAGRILETWENLKLYKISRFSRLRT
jgi:hypothetical protein